MVLQVLETHLMVIIAGFILGVLAARLYYKRNLQNFELGQAIEIAMINKKIKQLKNLSDSLLEIIEKLSLSGDELSEQVNFAQDIEKSQGISKFGFPEIFDTEPKPVISENIYIDSDKAGKNNTSEDQTIDQDVDIKTQEIEEKIHKKDNIKT